MATQSPYQNDKLAHFRQPSYPLSHQPHSSSEDKVDYDNYVDYNAAPYIATARHQTFNVDPEAMAGTGQHRRGPSIPLSKYAMSSKQSIDTSEQSHGAYPPVAPIVETDDRTFWQKILPESMACRLYVLTVLIETTIDLAIESDLLVRVHREMENKPDQASSQKMPAYLSIFVLAHIFQFVMAIDAVYFRNTLQFICLTVFNAVFLIYSIIQIREIRDALADATQARGVTDIPINILTTIIPVVISISEIAYIALGWKIYHEFGWKVYKFLGADRRIKKMYANYQIYECLVKFDVFFWAGFSVQFIWLVLRTDDWEYYVTCAALPLSLVLLVEGHLAARYENKWMMGTFMSGCVGAMVYFVYKLVKVLMYKESDEFKFIWKTLTIFSVVAIVLLFATFVYSIMVLLNFGRGLKDALVRKNQQVVGTPHRRAASATLNRMSIN